MSADRVTDRVADTVADTALGEARMAPGLWTATLPADLAQPLGSPLPGDRDVDIAIVGGGFTGLWTAYYLTEADPALRIAIVEARSAGFGASGRNGGWASALFPASVSTVARASGRDAAIRFVRALQDNVAALGHVVESAGWDVEWARGGTVVAARSTPQWERARSEIDEWRRWGFGPDDYRLLDAAETRERVGATDVIGGTFTPHCAALHPGRLVRSLAREVVRRGVDLYEDTPATAIEPGRVHTSRGVVRAANVVRALEGYTATLRGQRRTLAPVYSLMLATEPLEDSDWATIGLADRETFSDGRHLIIYGQRTADGRLAFGGRGAPYHFGSRIRPEQDRNDRVFQDLWRTLVDLFPVIAGREVTHTWGGPLGIPRDWFPSCGVDRASGLAWSGGYVGDGVAAAHLGGRTLADLLLDRPSEFTTLPWVGHRSPPWEPEPLRWTGTRLGLSTMTRADETEARTGRASRRAAIVGRLLGH